MYCLRYQSRNPINPKRERQTKKKKKKEEGEFFGRKKILFSLSLLREVGGVRALAKCESYPRRRRSLTVRERILLLFGNDKEETKLFFPF